MDDCEGSGLRGQERETRPGQRLDSAWLTGGEGAGIVADLSDEDLTQQLAADS